MVERFTPQTENSYTMEEIIWQGGVDLDTGREQERLNQNLDRLITAP